MATRTNKTKRPSRIANTQRLGWLIDADIFREFTELCDKRKFSYRVACEAAFALFTRMPKDIQRDACEDPRDEKLLEAFGEAMQYLETHRAQRLSQDDARKQEG